MSEIHFLHRSPHQPHHRAAHWDHRHSETQNSCIFCKAERIKGTDNSKGQPPHTAAKKMLWYYQAFKLLQQKFGMIWGCMLERSSWPSEAEVCLWRKYSVVTGQSTVHISPSPCSKGYRNPCSITEPLFIHPSPLWVRTLALYRIECATSWVEHPALGRSGMSSPTCRGAMLRLQDTAECDHTAETRVLSVTNNLHAAWCTQNHSAPVV